MGTSLSKPTRERLIRLVRILAQFEANHRETVSSGEIEKLTGWTSDTIRRDISQITAECSTPQGYTVAKLRGCITAALNLTSGEKRCCIVGMGRLGEALARFGGFAEYGFSLVAGFDSRVNRVETLVVPFPLYTVSNLERVIAEERITYAILAVPEDAAQSVATRLAMCGIKGIVNCTAAFLRVTEPTRVHDLSVMQALLELSSWT